MVLPLELLVVSLLLCRAETFSAPNSFVRPLVAVRVATDTGDPPSKKGPVSQFVNATMGFTKNVKDGAQGLQDGAQDLVDASRKLVEFDSGVSDIAKVLPEASRNLGREFGRDLGRAGVGFGAFLAIGFTAGLSYTSVSPVLDHIPNTDGPWVAVIVFALPLAVVGAFVPYILTKSSEEKSCDG